MFNWQRAFALVLVAAATVFFAGTSLSQGNCSLGCLNRDCDLNVTNLGKTRTVNVFATPYCSTGAVQIYCVIPTNRATTCYDVTDQTTVYFKCTAAETCLTPYPYPEQCRDWTDCVQQNPIQLRKCTGSK
jgi:hypothetical protein